MYKKGNINVFKLTSGEEFMAKIEKLSSLAVVVSNPVYLVKSEEGIKPSPFMPVAKADVSIMKDHIMVLGTPTDGALKGYKDMHNIQLLTE